MTPCPVCNLDTPTPPLMALYEAVEGIEELLSRLAPEGEQRDLLWDYAKDWIDAKIEHRKELAR
jgi:hypothetical protein